MTLDDLLSEAYGRDQLAADRNGAVTLLKDAFIKDAEMMAAAREEIVRLDAVVEARGSGGMHGDHISVVLQKLLRESLK